MLSQSRWGCLSFLNVFVAAHLARLKLLCLYPSDQRSALFWRLCSAGCQLPIGHRHHLPAQWRMRKKDLHPGRIHADGCRLVEMQAQPEPCTLQWWREINHVINFWFLENVWCNHTADKPLLFRRADGVHHQQKQKKIDKRINWRSSRC